MLHRAHESPVVYHLYAVQPEAWMLEAVIDICSRTPAGPCMSDVYAGCNFLVIDIVTGHSAVRIATDCQVANDERARIINGIHDLAEDASLFAAINVDNRAAGHRALDRFVEDPGVAQDFRSQDTAGSI